MVSQEPDSALAWSWPQFYFSDSPDDSLKDGKGANYWLWWIGIGIAYITYYLTMVVAKPKVICSGKALKEIIVEHCPIFYECYWPVVWAFNSHIMTVIRARIQYSPKVEYQRYLQMNVVNVHVLTCDEVSENPEFSTFNSNSLCVCIACFIVMYNSIINRS